MSRTVSLTLEFFTTPRHAGLVSEGVFIVGVITFFLFFRRPSGKFCLMKWRIYRAFHNVFLNYKNLLWENRRTRIYETCIYKSNNSKIFFSQ